MGGNRSATTGVQASVILAVVIALVAAAPDITAEQSAALLMLNTRATPAMLEALQHEEQACAAAPTAPTSLERCRVRAIISVSYASDPQAQRAALHLYDVTGTVAGLLPEQDFDGAYRGQLHLVPRLPVGPLRRHLVMASDALFDLDDLFARLGGPVTFRWRPLGLRFFESVKRRTPSAFAVGWTVSYNVNGSLFTTNARVRETSFHEVFHLNDFAHDEYGWSRTHLAGVYQRIVARCGTTTSCLTPYAPDGIKVRGGTYYAFMPDNGVVEYAADVAKRWYVEQRLVLHGQRVRAPFKCGPAENAEAWKAVVDEFFGGLDRVPACAQRSH